MTKEDIKKMQLLFGEKHTEWQTYFNLIQIKSMSIISEFTNEQRVCVTDIDGEIYIVDTYEDFLKQFDSKHPKHRNKKLKRIINES